MKWVVQRSAPNGEVVHTQEFSDLTETQAYVDIEIMKLGYAESLSVTPYGDTETAD